MSKKKLDGWYYVVLLMHVKQCRWVTCTPGKPLGGNVKKASKPKRCNTKGGKMTTISVKIPRDMLEMFELAVKATGRSRSDLLKDAARRYVPELVQEWIQRRSAAARDFEQGTK